MKSNAPDAVIRARNFLNRAKALNWNIGVPQDHCQTISISKSFEKGNNDELCRLESEAHELLGSLNMKGGSMWGLDGVARLSALHHGHCRMCKSGSGEVRMLRALKELL